MTREQLLERLQDHLDHRGAVALPVDLRQALESDAELSAEWEAMQLLHADLDSLRDAEGLPLGGHDRIMAAVRDSGVRERVAGRRGNRLVVVLAVAAAIIALVFIERPRVQQTPGDPQEVAAIEEFQLPSVRLSGGLQLPREAMERTGVAVVESASSILQRAADLLPPLPKSAKPTPTPEVSGPA